MHIEARTSLVENPFLHAREGFEALVARLASAKTRTMTHGQVERLVEEEGTEVLRRLYQGYLDAHGPGMVDEVVVGSDRIRRRYERQDMRRRLKSVFGTVEVTRTGYSAPETSMLFPRDAELNLPPELYSHGVQRRLANEVAKTSFDASVAALAETTGTTVPKRQAEELAARAAEDFDEFYATRSADTRREARRTGPVLAISVDGKGIVVRTKDLREATRKAAAGRQHKLRTRLSKGEKRNCKRMATVATVFTIDVFKRTAEDIVGDLAPVHDTSPPRPRPEHKRVWASLEKAPEEIIEEAFVEAKRRDPACVKQWVALVDGNPTQLKLLKEAAARHGVALTIILDIIHLLDYLWAAALVFHNEGTPAAEKWVTKRLKAILRGKSSDVAAGIRRSATLQHVAPSDRAAADDCADYLIKYRPHLRYDEYLAAGYPIATGVIEGACRHLIKDRLDITGARWGLCGAEAILRLRSVRSSGDWNEYWDFHENREWLRHHATRYAGAPPATVVSERRARNHLSLVK